MKLRRLYAQATSPSAIIVEELNDRLEGMRANPVGVDTLSEIGYQEVIRLVSLFSSSIDTDDPQSNAVWGILVENAKYFTTAEYLQIIEMIKGIMGV